MKTLRTLFIVLLAIISSGLVAQPFVREWASFYGPESSQIANLVEDRKGNLYGSLYVNGSPYDVEDYMNSFTTPGAFDSYGNDETSIKSLFFKLDPQGEVVWSSFFPGEIDDVTLSPSGKSIYLTGTTNIVTDLIASESAPFPDRYEFGEDSYHELSGFIVKFDTNNGEKIWGTYLPAALSVEADGEGNVYVAGRTYLPDLFGTEGVFEPDFIYEYVDDYWEPNAYLLKINPQGQIEWSTYNGLSVIYDIATKDGEVYIAGAGSGEIDYFATDGAFVSGLSGGAILSKFTTSGQRVWSTYYGNNQPFDGIYRIKITPNEKVLISGYTKSTENISSAGTFRENMAGSSDYFLACFDTEGNREWGTYYGNSLQDVVIQNNFNIMDASPDYIYVVGSTNGNEGVATEDGLNPERSSNSPYNYDAFLNVFDYTGKRVWGTYYGGTNNEFSSGALSSINGTDFFLYGGSMSVLGGVSTPNGAYPDFSFSPFGNHTGAMNGYIVKFTKEEMGLSSIGDESEIKLYPNPNQGRFSLVGTVLGKEEFQMQIFELSGKLIVDRKLGLYEQQFFDYSSQLNSGVYILKLTSESSKIQKTFKMLVK